MLTDADTEELEDISTSIERRRTIRAEALGRSLNALLPLFPEAHLLRQAGQTHLIGELYETTYAINFGAALCERVQTGTRAVEKIDPDWEQTAPKVTVEEPVYEWRCTDSDPLNDSLGGAK